jgi:hypothetical protein
MEFKSITDQQAADELGVQRQWLNAVKNGTPAGRKLALKILEWSKGAVTLEEVLIPKKE